MLSLKTHCLGSQRFLTRVCVASTLRCIAIKRLGLTNISYAEIPHFTWVWIEVGVGIICPCLITLRPLLRRARGQCADSAALGRRPRSPATPAINTISLGPSGILERISTSHDGSFIDNTKSPHDAGIVKKPRRPTSDSWPMDEIRAIDGTDVESAT